MSKLFRAASTVMIAIGMVYLVIYTRSQYIAKLTILDQPSYYVARDLWLMFLAGIVVVAFGVLSSFFSWFKKMDPEKGILPNAGYATDQDIHTWVSGEADRGAGDGQAAAAEGGRTGQSKRAPVEPTEILTESTEILAEPTEILPDQEGGPVAADDKTEILRREDEV